MFNDIICFLYFDTLLHLKWKPYLLLGYLAQPGLKMVVDMGCAKSQAEQVERLLDTKIVPED